MCHSTVVIKLGRADLKYFGMLCICEQLEMHQKSMFAFNFYQLRVRLHSEHSTISMIQH